MSAYPILVLKQSGRAASSSGGKDYHLVKITTAAGDTLIIHRWGKKDAWGVGLYVERHGDEFTANRAFEKKWQEKLGKEYSEHFLNKTVSCVDEIAFRKALGPYFFKMAPADLTWLVPGIDTDGAKAQKNIEWSERANGSFEAIETVGSKLIEDVPEPVADRVAENPSWGTW